MKAGGRFTACCYGVLVTMRFSLFAFVNAVLILFTGPAVALELLVVERANCSWCRLWNEEIAPVYPKSKEGGVAPIVRADVRELPDVVFSGPIEYTPTFVVIDNNREVDRIVGYSSQQTFWESLDVILDEHYARAK